MESFIEFYNKLYGYSPYDYQVKVAELLLQGKNVVISVPTGAGKTNASVAPFLYAIEKDNEAIPHKMIYSLPLRTLSNSIYGDLKSTIERAEFKKLKELMSIQTGEVSDDPMFERTMVISTIDQTLSSFLCFPLSVSHSQANINAGAIIGSYLIFDEFHLLDSKLSMATTLGMLQLLSNLSRICIMTATLSDGFINFLHSKFGFEIVSISDFPNDISRIKSLKKSPEKNVKKSVTVVANRINAEDIIVKHSNKTIVICNRVETAQQLFEQIKDQKKESTEVICLHSRFFDSDRKKCELKIKEYFGKKSDKQDVILISTQVIEAGMDISCDIMHTEISPINSFLQRAGRCARFENEYGQIFVYDVLDLEEKERITESGLEEGEKNEIKKLNSKYLPYDKELCVNSIEKLSGVEYIDENVSERLVNDVLADEEEAMIKSMSANSFNLDQITESWKDCDKKHYKSTIRDIQSVELVLIDLKNSTELVYNPWQYETISLYRWSFINWAKKITESYAMEDDMIFAKAIQGIDSQFDFDWDDRGGYFLRPLSVDEMKNYYDIIFVDNRYFDYMTDMGLVVRKNDRKKISPLKLLGQNGIKENISYKKDTLLEHSVALVNCYENDFKKEVDFALKNLNDFWKKESSEENIDWEWESLIRMMLCYHDFGKLNKNWQSLMLNYQRRKINDENYYEVLAHTDYDTVEDKQLGDDCRINQKPPHAGIGALQVYNIIYDTFEENEALARAVSNAILKHHSVDTNSFCNFEINSAAIKEFNKLLDKCDISAEQLGYIKEREDKIDECETPRERIVYLFLVRILRLCDQRATSNIEKYYKL